MQLFRPDQSDDLSKRKMFNGESTGIIDLNNQLYKWAEPLYQQMRNNFWRPMKFDLTDDISDFTQLTKAEQKAFKGQLSYLTFLDSVQVHNLPYLQRAITAPELVICVAEQTSQEAMHAQSYAYIIETLLPPEERDLTYHFWKEHKILYERCKAVATLYDNAILNPTEENITLSFFSDYLLESIFFYTGFMFFYTLLSRQKMCNTADIIKLINRDEYLHLKLFQRMCEKRFEMTPNVIPDALELAAAMVENEINWNTAIIGNASTEQLSQETSQEHHFR